MGVRQARLETFLQDRAAVLEALEVGEVVQDHDARDVCLMP